MYSNTCKNMLNYSYKYTYIYMIILIRIHVILLYQNCGLVTCKMKSISTIITMSLNIITI